ncbi:MAG: tetratricopeptide repeat protein [Elusimicrobiota bacterium]
MISVLVIVLLRLGSPAVRAEDGHPPAGSVYAEAAEDYKAGVALAARKSYPEAVAKLSEAVRLNPKFGNAYFWIGACEFAQGHDASAGSNWKLALANTRDTSQLALIHYNLGVLYLKSGDKPLSDAEYGAAVSLNPLLANRPIVARPNPAPAPAPAPLPVVPALLIGAVFLAGLLALVIALSRRRRDAAPAAVESAAAPGIDELRRAVASWSPEEELRSAPSPRPVKLRSPVAYWGLFAIPLVYVLVVTLIAAPSTVKRGLISWRGVAGTGTVLRKFQVRRAAKHGSYLENRLEFSYAPAGGGPQTAEAPTGDDSSVAVGQTVPIRFLPDYPGWAALDDDFGFSAQKMKIFWVLAATGVGTSVLILLVAWPRIRRERRLIQSGRICAARIAAVQIGAKGMAAVSFHYEVDGQVRPGTFLSTRSQNLQPGEVLTAMIDPADPLSATIYKASAWRVAAPY